MEGKIDEPVANWYRRAYTDDEYGANIDDNINFIDLARKMRDGEDIYNLIGVEDSLVRERVFTELASRIGVNYDDIYHAWLYSDKAKEFLPSL